MNIRRGLMSFRKSNIVPIWTCKKQTSVSHSSTESEIISLDADLRMNGIPALDLWDVVIEVLHSSNNETTNQKDLYTEKQTKGSRGNCVRDKVQNIRLKRVALDWLFCKLFLIITLENFPVHFGDQTVDLPVGRINLDPKIQIKFVDTKNQLADLLTKGSFTRDEWCNLLCLSTLWIFLCFLAAIFVQLKRRPPGRREFKKGKGRRTCGSKAEVSLFDFNKPEQRTIFFLWSGCFQRTGNPQLDSGSVKRSRGKLQAGHCPRQSPKPRNVFSSVERRQPVSKGLREIASGHCPGRHA